MNDFIKILGALAMMFTLLTIAIVGIKWINSTLDDDCTKAGGSIVKNAGFTLNGCLQQPAKAGGK